MVFYLQARKGNILRQMLWLKFLFITILSLGFISFSFKSKIALFAKYDCYSRGKICLIFIDNRECLACSPLFYSIFKYANDSKNFNSVAIIEGKRQIEIKKFRKDYNWKQFCESDSKSFKKEHGIKSSTKVAIISIYGDIVEEFTLNKMLTIKDLECFFDKQQN